MSEPTPTFERQEPTIATVPTDTVAQPRRIVTGGISWRKTFAALRHRNYRFFFFGQFVSVIGTWMQQVAVGWLVYDISKSAERMDRRTIGQLADFAGGIGRDFKQLRVAGSVRNENERLAVGREGTL